MRKEIYTFENILKLHIEYGYMTTGELGNILIRLQAALRALAGLSPGGYNNEYFYARPRFTISSVDTKHSIDINIALSILAIAMATPGAVNDWRYFAPSVFRMFKIAILAIVKGKIEVPEENEKLETSNDEQVEMIPVEKKSLKIEVTKGNINIDLNRETLNQLSPTQRKKLANFISSLTIPSNKVEIGDDESQITIDFEEKNKD